MFDIKTFRQHIIKIFNIQSRFLRIRRVAYLYKKNSKVTKFIIREDNMLLIKDLPQYITPLHIKQVLRIGQRQAYQLTKQMTFKT